MTLLRALAACRRGSIAVEAAGVLILLAVAAVGATDGARWLRASALAERMASNLADMAARSDALRDRPEVDALSQPGDVGMFFKLGREMAEASGSGTAGIALASLSGRSGGNAVNWMRADGTALDETPGRLADLPSLPADTHYIVAEVAIAFAPALLDAATFGVGLDRMIRRRAIFRTRTSALTSLTTDGTSP